MSAPEKPLQTPPGSDERLIESKIVALLDKFHDGQRERKARDIMREIVSPRLRSLLGERDAADMIAAEREAWKARAQAAEAAFEALQALVNLGCGDAIKGAEADLADYIRDQVCCPRIHGCELGGSEECPAERVRASLLRVTEERGEALAVWPQWALDIKGRLEAVGVEFAPHDEIDLPAALADWIDGYETECERQKAVAEASLSALRGEVTEVLGPFAKDRVGIPKAWSQAAASLLSTLEGNTVSRTIPSAHVAEATATEALRSDGSFQDPKYEFIAGGVKNRQDGRLIPHDEPVFVFRARDRHAATALTYYQSFCHDAAHREAIGERIEHFEQFARQHPSRMKEPDTQRQSENSDAVAVGPSPTCARNETRDEPLQTPTTLEGEEPCVFPDCDCGPEGSCKPSPRKGSPDAE